MNITGTQPQPQAQVQVAPARYVTIPLAEACTGLTASAIRTKIARGVWVEGRQYIRAHGHVFIDLKGYEAWVQQAA